MDKRKKVILELMKDPIYKPMKIKELAMLLQVPRERRAELEDCLKELESEGKIYLSKRGKYSLGQPSKIKGIFRANAKGFGFVTPENGGEDIYIHENQMAGAYDGDEVEVIIVKEGYGRKQEGKIVNIVNRKLTKVVGRLDYKEGRSYGFLIPDNKKIGKDFFIPAEKLAGAVGGDQVVAEITSYGDERLKPEAKIVEILGHKGEVGIDVLSIAKAYDLPMEFPEKVLNQAERVAKPVSEADCAGRLDLRSLMMVTIDGEDAKDLDDAVSLNRDGENYKLGVHIADVTNYVQENSALDWEALKRGTSVYLADRVIPMLPKTLSNGICSLNAGEDRLALSCLMTINPKGEIIDHQIAETVINVDRRMTYTSVKKILVDEDPEECQKYRDFVDMFREMAELSAILREKRYKRGAIDFDFPETKVILDEKGRPVELKPYDRNVATKLIEDFMLAANETVAEEYFWRELPFVYRIHEVPDGEKIRSLFVFASNFGYTLHGKMDEIRPKEIQKLISKAEGSPEEGLIGRLALRSMKQAKYTPENEGHFGLAAKYYTHFTSPIRRYPDLQIHRIIKEDLRGKLNAERIEHYEKILEGVTRQASDLERRAEETERETIKLKKAEYMVSHLGEEFEGIISGVTKWGIYVELPNTIEGLVHVMNMMDDHYEFVQEEYALVGIHTGKTYRLGQKVKVQVMKADTTTRTIDFGFATSSPRL